MSIATAPEPRLEADAPAGRAAGRTRRSQVRFEWPLLVLIALGALLRAATVIGYSPSVLQWVDAVRYARADLPGAFDDYYWPAGYPAFLAAVRSLTDEVSATVIAQHLLGLATAALIYAAIRRLGAPRLVAAVPTALAALGGDYLYLEHILMAEAFFTFLIVAGLYAGLRGLVTGAPRRLAWLGLGAALLTAAGLTRTTGLVLPVVLATVALLSGVAPRERIAAAGTVVATTAVLLAGYLALASTGPYAGITDMSGWHTYARIAPTADCSKFTPPAGTRFLCESTPLEDRNGSFYYEWDATSPARRRFTLPEGNAQVGAFGRAAIRAQPLAYVKAVVKDAVRWIEPSAGRDRPLSGVGPELISFGYRDRNVEGQVGRALDPRYDGALPVRADAMESLDTYQRLTQLNGMERLAVVLLALAGLFAARGPVRRAILLVAGAGFALLLVPAATLSWDYRYGLPPLLVVTIAASLGAWALWLRFARPVSPAAS